ncbi:pyridoxal phosphate-dependent aminotransferase [Enterococcus sp. 669A]|uniref:cysteine-S-conjugate beta-lyase n=1 Tax=Candidatus Enterococcus moelleringii TaxID=2815325 RepID=A0ABS3LEF9_9ENTE|nr:MalY/PatB family protein [Enterococcus sp. 669A]MBO1307413.1 pyridoxal phosphate-dependent aminotransferase [Enterococcus sp. 669A]
MEKFDQATNRFQTNSYKWEVSEGELPMWVADMDFQTAPVIIEAIKKRTDHGIFGYNSVPPEFNQAIASWWSRRHGLILNEDWIMFCTGVVPAISSIVRKLTKVGDNVVILSPVYNIFYNSIVNNYREVLSSDLVYNGAEYTIDFADLEAKLADENTSLMIFCNPHNPIGKIWDAATLEKVGQLCLKHGVVIISDEIHCDLTFPGEKYTPFYAVSEEVVNNVIMCCAATKAFNMAGLQTAAIVVKNEKLRKLVNRGINTDEVAEPNSFAIQAAIAAFTEGEPWLEELNQYLYLNRQYIEGFIAEYLPEITLVTSKATYLAWLDCSQLTKDAESLCQFIREKTGLYLTAGAIFGENGRGFIRLNYATNFARVEDGMQRLLSGVQQFKENSA